MLLWLQIKFVSTKGLDLILFALDYKIENELTKSQGQYYYGCKNGMPYLKESIKSYKIQDYKNKELIVVYSNSQDRKTGGEDSKIGRFLP